MCLAIPARVVALGEDDSATVELAGVRRSISLALVDGVAVDDYVIVHVGYALETLDPAEAERTLAQFEALGELDAAAAEAFGMDPDAPGAAGPGGESPAS